MKVSVLVVAHNEGKNIAQCLDSLLEQSYKPDEIVVIAHNCSDKTEEIVRQYKNIRLVSYNNVPPGVIYARIKGFEEANGEMVACIDGDCVAQKDWLINLIKPFKDTSVSAVGGFVYLQGSLTARFASYDFFFLSPIYRPQYRFYFWGANFACRKDDYTRVGGLEPLIELRKRLDLYYWAEDLYLSLALSRIGDVVFVPTAKVLTQIKDNTFTGWSKRGRHQREDKAQLFKHFHLKS